MIKSFFISAVRHLSKHKSYTTLNILGLSIGLASFALIALWVRDELGFDRFHTKADRIYRIGNHFTDESGFFDQAVTPIPLAPALVADLPEVEAAVRIDPNGAVVRLDDKQFIESDLMAVDPSFFEVFSFTLKQGNAKTALQEPYNIVLSESMARKYFGEQDPIGKSITIMQFDPDGNGAEYKITGIIEDCPTNSHFNYNALISFKTVEAYDPETASSWFNNSYYTYILVKPFVNVEVLRPKLTTFLEKYIGKEMKQYKISWTYFLQPITDIHLRSNVRYEIKATSSVNYVIVFGTIGCIILFLACINYVNLSTAYSSDRFKEVGVRKVMGAYRNQLIGQYLVESWLLALTSLAVALAWIEMSRPLFESLTGKPVVGLYSLRSITILFTIASLTGLASGLYPSLVLSSFRTVNVLKGQFRKGTTGVLLRKGLVVLQYSITVVLICGIFIVQRQLKFIREKDLGFDERNLLVLNVNGSREVMRGYEGFSQELSSNPAVSGLARSNTMIAGGLGNSGATGTDATGKQMNSIVFRLRVDHDYIDTYGMQLIAGRNFIQGNAGDSARAFIINEATTRLYGYEDPAAMVGQAFSFNGIDGEIIGVVRDFHYNTLHQKIEPTCMYLLAGGFSRIAVRLEGDPAQRIEEVSSAWKKHFPQTIFEYRFAEDSLESQYQSEQRFSTIFLVFSALSLAIACLGLFSLVSYAVESRTKEIGIRKVLGASVAGIVATISWEFLVLIIISCALAIPVSYYFMDKWLEGFAYKVSINAWTFSLAAALALIIAMATISIKSIRSALTNPVDSLRNE